MDEFVRDWAAYAAGKYAAGREVGLTAENLNERAATALVLFLRSRNLSLRRTPQRIIRPIAEGFADGFLDEVVRRWGEVARASQTSLPTERAN